MKRSEALKVIGKLLMFGLEGMPREKIESYKNTAFADIILTELELLGMIPPAITVEQITHPVSVSSVNKYDKVINFEVGTSYELSRVNEWEPEATYVTEENDLCSYCNGTGESIPSPDMPCNKCKGSGVEK